MKPEFYVSLDIEADGPAPGINSMLALGAAAFFPGKDTIELWYSTLAPLPDAVTDSDTMRWWDTQPEAWKEVTANPKDPDVQIPDFAEWVEMLPGKPIAVAWPAGYDFAWVNWYCHKFAGRNPLGFACLDIRSYANGLFGRTDYYGITEDALRSKAGVIDTSDLRPHFAIDDAIEQGRLFMALRNSLEN